MSGFIAENFGKFTETRDVNTALQQGLLTKAFVGGQDYFECVVCHRSMAGTVPAEAHLGGSPHFKALRNYTYSSSLSESLSTMHVSERYLPEEDATVSSGHSGTSPGIVKRAIEEGIVTQCCAAGVTTLTCELCKVPCTGDAPMAQHLDGELHRKRQRRMGAVGAVSSGHPRSGAVHHETSFTFGATGTDGEDAIQKAFESGIIEREFSNGVDSLICKVCCKSCTGVVPMKQHLESSAHIRKQRTCGIPAGGGEKFASSILSSPTDYETLSVGSDTLSSRDYEEEVVPLVTDGSPSSSDDNRNARSEAESEEVVIEVDGSLMCMLCQVPCTGKANMAEHLQGDLHRRKWRDQIDQLKMFGTTKNVSTLRSTPSPKPSLSPKLPVENAKNSDTQKFLQCNSFNQSCRTLSIQQQPDRQRPYKKAKINLPENLRDLEVFFPDEPLSKNF